jgi:hypothetical protein
MLTCYDIFEKIIAPDTNGESPERSCRRLALTAMIATSHYTIQQKRFKKPFNPILGETYEYVTPQFRFMAEQVSHHPPITAFHYEGDGYECLTYSNPDQSFKFGGGTGQMYFKQKGIWQFKFSQFKDVIKLKKMNLFVSGIILGSMNFELDGEIIGTNETTGDTIELKFFPRKWRSQSYVVGTVKDKEGVIHHKLSGSWTTEIVLTNTKTGESEVILKCPEPVENSHRWYHFSKLGIQLNHITDEMKESGYLPKTDSRYRGDQRLFEQGKLQEADDEKVRLEIKQR